MKETNFVNELKKGNVEDFSSKNEKLMEEIYTELKDNMNYRFLEQVTKNHHNLVDSDTIDTLTDIIPINKVIDELYEDSIINNKQYDNYCDTLEHAKGNFMIELGYEIYYNESNNTNYWKLVKKL